MSAKRKSAILLATLYLITGCFDAPAQLVKSDASQLPRNYLIRVKQFNEFIGRFNYEKDFLNQDIGPAFSDKISREQYIGLLFNNASDDKMPEKTTNDTLVSDFIRLVCNDSLYIDTYSELVFAELKCRVTLNGKNSYLSVLARQEIDHGLKWSFVSVHPDFDPEGKTEEGKRSTLVPALRVNNPIIFRPLATKQILSC